MSFISIEGCEGVSKIKDIKVTSCGVENYSLKGLRSLDAVLAIGIDNPAMAFTVTGLSGILKYMGEEVALPTLSMWTSRAARSMNSRAVPPCRRI